MPGVDIALRKGNKVEVRHSETGDLLAWCYLGDDENIETIADLLSAKGQPGSAMKLRQMAQDARRAPGVGNQTRMRGI